MNLSLFLSVGFPNGQMRAKVIILIYANELKRQARQIKGRIPHQITQPLLNVIKIKAFSRQNGRYFVEYL